MKLLSKGLQDHLCIFYKGLLILNEWTIHWFSPLEMMFVVVCIFFTVNRTRAHFKPFSTNIQGLVVLCGWSQLLSLLLVLAWTPLIFCDASGKVLLSTNFPGKSRRNRPRHCSAMNRSAWTSRSLTLAGWHLSIINQPLCRLKVLSVCWDWNDVRGWRFTSDRPHFSQMTSN